MPQPLTKVSPTAELDSWGVGSLVKRPILALMFAQAITSWADVEYWLLALFVELLGGNKAIAAKIYLALDTARAKSQALEQLVEEIGDARQKAVTKAIVSISKSREKERDKLAHRVLGISNALEDALLLFNPKNITVNAAVHYDEILVYRENDFKSVIEGNLNLRSKSD